MSRVQLALNVRDVDAAVEFYGKLFGAEPAKRRPGYANFAIAEPPLKLVLIEDPAARGDGVAGALNHLGVEVGTSAEVGAATERLTGEGLATLTQDATTCCYAVQDKVWVHDPDGAPWEVYTVLADAPGDTSLAGNSGCSSVDGECVPTGGTPPGTLSTVGEGVTPSEHGVPVAAVALADTGTATATACCGAAVAESCCQADTKAGCCGDTTAALPASCGCQ